MKEIKKQSQKTTGKNNENGKNNELKEVTSIQTQGKTTSKNLK